MSVDFADSQRYTTLPWTTTGRAPRYTTSSPGASPVVHIGGWRQPEVSDSGTILSVLSAKISTLLRLDDGWNGPGSRRPADRAFDTYLAFLSSLGTPPTLDLEPVATSDGSVEVEWEHSNDQFTIEFQADGQIWLCADDSDEYVSAPADAANFYRMSRQTN